MSEIRIGISGWTFPGWRGRFYPKKLVQKKELEFASRQLNSIEINGTFYSLQRPTSFQSWYDQTPENFKFAIKAPQFMTHVLRLKEAYEPLCTFMASGLFKLKHKLGPILWQFPPNVMLKDDRFEKFLKLLPQDTRAAEQLAKNHSSRIDGRACTESEESFPMRHAFELRHPSFVNKDFIEMLKAYRVAPVFADGKKSADFEDACSDFVYLRMHGEDSKDRKGYTDEAIKSFAKRVRFWTGGESPKEVFLYFSNDSKVYAPQDALRMMKALRLKWKPQETLEDRDASESQAA